MSVFERVSDDLVPEPETSPRYLSLEDAGPMLEVLASETAQEIFVALCDDPATAHEVAGRVDTSIQNASYHLERLEEAGVVEVIGTRYSDKGREMDVYARAVTGFVIGIGSVADELTAESA